MMGLWPPRKLSKNTVLGTLKEREGRPEKVGVYGLESAPRQT